MREVNKEELIKEIEENEEVLVDFFATWCPPCKALAPILEEFANENTNVKVLKVNVDENQELAIEYGVTLVPTLIFIENGEVKKRNSGLMDKHELQEFIK